MRFLLILLSFISFKALANNANADLYDAVAPADSAFVRVLNISDGVVETTLAGKLYPQRVASGLLGRYRFTAPGNSAITVNGLKIEQALEANKAYTILYDGADITVISDKFVNEPRKAQVSLYNLTNQDVALKTSDGAVVVVDSIGTGETGVRLINEVKIKFSAFSGDKKISDFDEFFLRKGNSYSYVLYFDGVSYKSIGVMNSIDPTE